MELSPQMHKSIEACLACYTRCEETMSYCLQQGGAYADSKLMRALMDCAETSRMCAQMAMRMSAMTAEMCEMTARACEMCAEACAAMPDDDMLTKCAEACRTCATSCRSMAQAMTKAMA
ncbi:four-helix bundle copper-binding protein [Kitasatospora sp. NPDC085895]|uniref:four-helix bundle copper-binding protein n=1 Tax=Kitasatospora sp. NPDC085895 TaxID=3155057 RepID=UPI00344CDAA7